MSQIDEVKALLQRLLSLSEWNFAVGLHIKFANPTILYQNYPPEWLEYYQKEGLAFSDPTVRWAVQNVGICDWDELRDDDPREILRQAAEHGLRYGKIVSVADTSRSCAFFAQPHAPIKDETIKSAQTIVEELHHLTRNAAALPPRELADLRERPTAALKE